MFLGRSGDSFLARFDGCLSNYYHGLVRERQVASGGGELSSNARSDSTEKQPQWMRWGPPRLFLYLQQVINRPLYIALPQQPYEFRRRVGDLQYPYITASVSGHLIGFSQ